MTKVLIVLLIILAISCQCSSIPPTPMTATPIVPQPVTLTPSPVATLTAVASPTLAPTSTATPTQTNTPVPTVTAVPATVEPTPTLPPVLDPPGGPNFYIVQRDDWLIKIAQFLYGGQYGWEWACLYQVNRTLIGDDPNLIFAGQKLVGIRECGE